MNILGIGALVTGASRGLGAALAMRLADGGARVALVARGEDEVEQVALSIRAKGGMACAIAADVGDKRAAHAIAAIAAAQVGPVSLLVHNASTLGHVPLRALLDTDCEALEYALAVNAVGPLRLTKLVVPGMVLRGQGLVVNVTSDASVESYATWGAYGASKAALDHLGRVLSTELQGTGVRVLNVDPGEMNTRMHADAVPDADPRGLADPRAVAARIVELVRHAEDVASGSRVDAARWQAAP